MPLGDRGRRDGRAAGIFAGSWRQEPRRLALIVPGIVPSNICTEQQLPRLEDVGAFCIQCKHSSRVEARGPETCLLLTRAALCITGNHRTSSLTRDATAGRADSAPENGYGDRAAESNPGPIDETLIVEYTEGDLLLAARVRKHAHIRSSRFENKPALHTSIGHHGCIYTRSRRRGATQLLCAHYE